jgi:uncharacterized membrane protein
MNSKLKAAFIISIIINVLLIGIVFGALRNRFEVGGSRQDRFMAEVEKLPEPARSRMRDKMAKLRDDNDPLRDQMRTARNEAIRLLVAEPFDEPAYDRQVAKINELRAQITSRMSREMKEMIKDLPPEQRSAIGNILTRPPSSFR